MGQRSGLATNTRRVELYLTWTLYGGLCVQPLWILSAGPDAGWATLLVALLSVAHTVAAVLMARWSLRTMRRGGRFPRLPPAELRLVVGWLAGSLLLAGTCLAFATPVIGFAVVVWAGLALVPVLSALVTFLLATVLGALAGLAVGLMAGGSQGVVVGAVSLALAYVLIATYWLSALTLRVLWDLDEARGTAGRLAVAEERLRFARDLHDVFGRTLSAVAVKSELGAALARRGQAEKAATQMTEVRQLADDAGREVRAVVRGYRRADLAHEVVGARSVLQSAGVQTTIEGNGEDLPPEVSAALAWVAREAVTNVLRHSDASWCTLTIARTDSTATVRVENDRPHPAEDGRRGSGLTGLRERLAPIGGRVDVDHGSNTFSLTAVVGVSAPAGTVIPHPVSEPTAGEPEPPTPEETRS